MDYSAIFQSKEEFIFVFGGQTLKDGAISSVEVLDAKRGIWRIFKNTLPVRSNYQAIMFA